jgi:hypothetical protein
MYRNSNDAKILIKLIIMNKTLVCIVNHNDNDNAIMLKMMFSPHFETIIIDSKSDKVEDDFDIKLENVGYSGLFNAACEIAEEKGVDGILFICSDVSIKKKQANQIVDKISNMDPNEIGVYSPSSRGQSHAHCKKRGEDFREVAFVEGFMFYAFMDILKEVYPVDLSVNKLGHGLDAHKGLACIKNNKKCIIDDSIEIYHKEGTGYNTSEASSQFISYMNQHVDLKGFWNSYQVSGYNSDLMLKNISK